MNKLGYVIIVLLLITSCKPNKPKVQPVEAPIKEKPIYKYGYNIKNFAVLTDTVRQGDTFGVILDRHHMLPQEVYNIIETVKDSFDFKKIQVGKTYTILCSKDTLQKAEVLVYFPNKFSYNIIDFQDSIPRVINVDKPLKTIKKRITGIITTSLFETLNQQGLSDALAIELSNVYAWTVDFYRIQKYDKFKVIYDEVFVDDTISVGVKKIHAALFEHWGQPYYAFGFQSDSIEGIWQYYDEKAEDLKKMFLKSPIEFARVSSRYNMRRYVSIYGRIKPHLGTDFAAPVGTPIRTTANGVVTESRYKRGNGNYVKVKHNRTYSTQYLHMSKRAVKRGDYVKQGQVIGYVGMTGHTTGPHVCYRFWKNGKQVDALKQRPVKSAPVPEKARDRYFSFIKPLRQEIDNLPYSIIIKDDEKNQEENDSIITPSPGDDIYKDSLR